MPRRLRWLLLYACPLLGLAGCTISTYSGVTTPPCAAQTAAAATASPTLSLGTRTTGSAIVITTDRTVYAPQDHVFGTITNQIHASSHLPVVIELGLSNMGGCPDVQAERWQGSRWEDVRVCEAPGRGEANMGGSGIVRIEPGKTYDFGLTPARRPSTSTDHPPFPTGTYQVVIRFNLLVNFGSVSHTTMTGGYGFIATSQPFRVCTCGVCA
jgi:hypothetical protein